MSIFPGVVMSVWAALAGRESALGMSEREAREVAIQMFSEAVRRAQECRRHPPGVMRRSARPYPSSNNSLISPAFLAACPPKQLFMKT